MQSVDLIARLNNLTNNEEVTKFYKAFHQDQLIWDGFISLNQDTPGLASFANQNRPFNPGTLGLISLDPNFDFSTLPIGKIPVELLEKVMLRYETYVTNEAPVESLEDATLIALALIEKHQISTNWEEILGEIVTRMKITTREMFVQYWSSILVIVLNLIEDKNDFLKALTSNPNPEIMLGVFKHLVLCLPVSDEEKIDLFATHLYPLNANNQALALRILKRHGDSNLTKMLAVKLLEKYQNLEIGHHSTGEYWKTPIGFTESALLFQSVADIALYAGENQTASLLNKKALEILKALVNMGKVRMAGMSGEIPGENNPSDLFSREDLDDPQVQSELIYKDGEIQIPESSVNFPIKLIKQSQKMIAAGNAELAKEEIKGSLKNLKLKDLEQALVEGPEQISLWDPIEYLNTLVEVEAYEEAGQLAEILLRENPTSIPVNQASARAAMGRKDYKALVKNLEILSALQPDSIEIKRNLASAYINNDAIPSAFDVFKKIFEIPGSIEDADLETMAEIALKVEKPMDSLQAASQLLKRNPEHARAYTIAGIAYRQTGQNDLAMENLQKAIGVCREDIRPWLELAEMQWSAEDHNLALSTLREAIAANPGSREVQCVYAKRLMQEGLISESYPLLLQLSSSDNDLEIDLLLIDAMERLGMEGVDETLETMSNRYPEDKRFTAEYGRRLVWKGITEKGLALLNQAGDEIWNHDDLALAYAEAMLKPDYQFLVEPKKITNTNRNRFIEVLDKILIVDPENERARLLKAESMLIAGEPQTAYQYLNELFSETIKSSILQKSRLLADLAQCAARSGIYEVAHAALDQALEMEPNWFGLQRIKAENIQLEGDFAEAVKQVFYALEMAPESAENYLWAADFLRTIDEVQESEKIVAKAIEKYPNYLGLRLRQAEDYLSTSNGNVDLVSEDKIQSLVKNSSDVDDLIKAGIVFAMLENQEQTVFCLEKAAGLGSLEAKFYLAGMYRIRQEYDHAQKILNTIENQKDLIDLLTLEMLFTQGKPVEVSQIQLNSNIQLPEIRLDDLFLPGSWKEFLSSSRPGICLAARIALKMGEPATLLDEVRSWIENQPGNLEARVYGIELALACSAKDDYLSFVNHDEAGQDIFGNQFRLLHHEFSLEQEKMISGQVAIEDLYQVVTAEDPEIIAVCTEMAALGNLAEAETTFDMVRSVFSNIQNKPYICQVGILRNEVKAAISMERWQDAFEISDEAVNLAPQNDSLRTLQIRTRALGFEFRNRSSELAVEKHTLPDNMVIRFAAIPEIDLQHVFETQKDELNRWMLRLRLALGTSKENIRDLAKLVPHPEDATAMMAGLRAINQVNTALQVGKKFDSHPMVLFELALCESETKPQMAMEYIEKSLGIRPNDPLSLRLRARLLEKSGRISEAVLSLEEALTLWPNEPGWHMQAAALWQQLGNVEKPMEHLLLADLHSPGNVAIQRSLGQSYLAVNKADEALSHFLVVVEKEPHQYETWGMISEAYQLKGDLELALNAAEKAVQINPSAVKAHLQVAKISAKKGDQNKALDEVKVAISLDPEDGENYVFMAKLCVDQGNNGNALELLEKASQCKNPSLNTVIEHANLVKTINGAAAARDLIETFSKNYPENPELLKLLAEAEDQCGDLKKAEAAGKKALEIHSGESDLHMLLGKILEKTGNLDQAISYYGKAVALDPSIVEAYLKLSQVFIKRREYAKARDVLNQGIEKVPGVTGLYLSCADLCKEAKDYQGAEAMLRKAADLEPRNLNIHRQLGAVLALNMVHQSQEVSSQI